MRLQAALTAANAAAITTAAVPRMSSLNVHTLIGVLVQNSAGIACTEVLPVQHGVREQLGRGGDVGVNQVVVALVANPRMSVSDVHLVVDQARLSVPMSRTTGITRR